MQFENLPCPVCSAPAQGTGYSVTWRTYDCEVCGKFGIEDGMLDGPTHLDIPADEKLKWKQLLAERRIAKRPMVVITSQATSQPMRGPLCLNREEFIAEYPKTQLEFFDRALMNLSRVVGHPTAPLNLNRHMWPALFSEQNEGPAMIRELEELGWIRSVQGSTYHTIAAGGWTRIEQLAKPGTESRQAFVAMWFNPSRDEIFKKAIKPAVESDNRTKAIRIDGQEHLGKIDDAIIAEIRKSRYLVADFTGDRGGIYFEAGFAQGLGIPVIFCVEERDIEKLHFDTRQYNHVTYTSAEDFREKLTNRIRANAL